MPPETASDSTVDKLKIWAFPALLAVLQLVFTNQIVSAANDIKETRKDIIELNSTVKVQTAQMEYLTQRVSTLEGGRAADAAIHKEIEQRLNSLEQRAAMHDEFISSHKYK